MSSATEQESTLLLPDHPGLAGHVSSEFVEASSPAHVGRHQFPLTTELRKTAAYRKQLVHAATPLLTMDLVSLAISVFTAFALVAMMGKEINHLFVFMGGVLLANLLCFWSVGLYPGLGMNPAQEMQCMFRATVSCGAALVFGLVMVGAVSTPYLAMCLISHGLQIFLLPIGRGIAREFARKAGISIPLYIVGSRSNVSEACRKMTQLGWNKLQPVGRFSPQLDVDHEFDHSQFDVKNPNCGDEEFDRDVPYQGGLEQLIPKARRNDVFWLIIVDEHNDGRLFDSMEGLHAFFPQVVLLHSGASHRLASGSVVNCGIASGVRVEERLLLPWPNFQKRLIDVVISGTLLCLLSPVLLFIALLVKLSSPGPILYGSERLGRDGKRFNAWKFRSMVPDAKHVLEDYLNKHPKLRAEWESNHKLSQDPRITSIGKILRKTSLDEIPQLWNVFVGEMSLVGPRPMLPEEIEKYGAVYLQYARMRPGITGLWQIMGRNKTSYDARLQYISFYVSNWSPWLDIYILLRTVKTVALCEGAC